MATYYAAVDMGASSGRLILGHMENGKIELEEIHRFENGMVKKDGELCWEFDRIFKEIVTGLKKCKEIGKIPVSMGVDTWGVDFVLLDILYLKSPQGTALGGKQPLLSTECPSQNLRFFDVRFARLLSERHLKTFGFFDVRCAHIIS